MMLNWESEYGTQLLDTFVNGERIQHLKIWRHDGGEVLATWSTLQAIKDEIVGLDVPMFELYPRNMDVVNEVNYRHLWSLPIAIQHMYFMSPF